jgi:hypothetical protein
MVQGHPRQRICETSISKITRPKIDWRCGSSVEHLLCQHEALTSNPSPTIKKKTEKKTNTVGFHLYEVPP